MREETIDMLISTALSAREKSYCPYSSFAVGAALLTDEGRLYTGANIENSAFSPTICAERVALHSAIHAGERNFYAIAIVGGKVGEEVSATTPPCGVCRQVMAEFCRPDMQIILFDGEDSLIYTLDELLPAGFSRENLD